MQTAAESKSANQLNDLGNALIEQHDLDGAIDAYRRAIAQQPEFAAAHSNLGAALRDAGRIDEALASHKRALGLNPRSPASLNNLGVALTDAGWFGDAIKVLDAATKYDRNYAEAWTNLGIAYLSSRDSARALEAGRRAVAINPQLAKAHMNLAMILLSAGNLCEGFAEHEWRFRCHDKFQPRQLHRPIWDGKPLDGTLVVHAEQGFGDTIHFVRYVERARKLCRRVVMEVHPELARLMSHLADEVVCRGEPLPPFDVHCSMMSLPAILQLDSYDASTYLLARPKLAQPWLDRLGSRPRFGICHRGNPKHSNDRNRSMPSESIAPLMERHNVLWINLVKQEGDASSFGIDFTHELNDFADTAALVSNVDLVIAVDTAVAHLACAIGKPCWVMLPYVAEWRWQIEGESSPWYPSARLFRQSKPGDWSDVVERVSVALSELHDVQ